MLTHHRSATRHCAAIRSIAVARSGGIARTKSLTYRIFAGLTFVGSLSSLSSQKPSTQPSRLGDHLRVVLARQSELYQSEGPSSRKIWSEFRFYRAVASAQRSVHARPPSPPGPGFRVAAGPGVCPWAAPGPWRTGSAY